MNAATKQPCREIVVSGVGHTRFGRLDEEDVESLVAEAVRGALADADVPGDAVDAIFFGNFNAGMQPLAFGSSLALQADDGLLGVPATRVENACASGSAAVHQGIQAILAGAANTVLVVGAEKMTNSSPETVGRALLGADYDAAGTASHHGFAGLFAAVAHEYQRRYGSIGDEMAWIAAKNHANGLANPYAHLRKDFSFDFCRDVTDANPMVAHPLRRTDCSPVSDGAAALVLQRENLAERSLARIVGYSQSNDYLPAARRDPLAFEGTKAAVEQALKMSNRALTDLDFAEVHDCFTIAELLVYEAIGLAEPGRAREVVNAGTTLKDGRLPVNPSGGLKSKGHPVGATGVSQHVLAALQLSGRAGDMQVPDAGIGLVHNMGGLAVANYATIMESL